MEVMQEDRESGFYRLTVADFYSGKIVYAVKEPTYSKFLVAVMVEEKKVHECPYTSWTAEVFGHLLEEEPEDMAHIFDVVDQLGDEAGKRWNYIYTGPGIEEGFFERMRSV